ncbi:MAG: DUF3048 domain-containing protein, partial [Clostridia bacterium]|nr:DUF3048 domain-containing protein [Clostridia bacterium]
PEPTPYDGPENPLTGMPIDEKWVNQRPVAIMLNNLKQALPQLGQSKADIIYECLAEGGITRMLGVYQSVEGVGMIGSVRSSRPYYLELALGHDAIYLHAGGSEDAYAKIKEWGVTALDCVRGPYEGKTPGSNLFWRDADRRKNNGLEHSVVTTGDTIMELFPTYSFRRDHKDGYVYAQAFSDDGTPAGGAAARKLTVPFSSYKTGIFTYDAASGKYLVEEYGKAYVDGDTGEQVGATNVLVLKTACGMIKGDELGHVTVNLTGSGDGYFACGGKIIPIQWSKDGRNSQFVYTTADGKPLTLGRGNSYVNIIPLESSVTYEG